MADGFSFEDALKPAPGPKGFSFDEALASHPGVASAPDTSAMSEFPTYAAPASSEPAPGNAVVERIGHAAADAFDKTPEVLTPAAREAVDKYGGTGPFGVGEAVNRVAHGATNVIGAAHAGMAALSQAAMEVFGEKGGRDALALLSTLPMAQGERMSPNVAAPSETASRPQFVSERFAPNVSELDPRNAIQKLIQHDITENPPALVADIGKAPDIDTAIAAAGKAVQAPAERPMAQWMQPIARDATVPENALTGEVLPPEPGARPQSMADYLKANSKDVAEPMPTPQAIATSIDAGDVVNTSKASKKIASAYYKIMDEAGGELLPPDVTNKTLSYARGLAEEDPMVTDARGTPHPIAGMVDRLEKYRDKPMSLQAQTGLDRYFGDQINKEYDNRGHISSEGQAMLDLQTHLRGLVQNEIDNPEGAGLPGFEAKLAANKAWSATMKLDDLERMKERADRTLNPDQSIRTQINTYLSNKTRSRGLTDAERAAYETAAKTGMLDGALKIVGSRLVPIALGTHGALTLNPATLAAGGAGMAASAMARRGLVAIQNRRLSNVADVIGSSVPPAP